MRAPSPQHPRFLYTLKGGFFSALLFSLGSGLIGDMSAVVALVPLFVSLLRSSPKDLPESPPLKELFTDITLPFVLSLATVFFLTKPEQALSYAFYVAIPGFSLPLLALRYRKQDKKKIWYPFEKLMGLVGLYILGYTLVLTLLWQLSGLNETALSALQAAFATKPLEAQGHFTQLLTYLKRIWPYVPGISLSLLVLMLAISTSLTQRWFMRRNLPFPRTPFLLSDLYLPWGFWKALAGFGTLFALASFAHLPFWASLFGNLTAPLLSFFLLQGLAVVMVFAKKQSNPKMFLVIFYAFMLVFGWTSLILILGGLLEPWVDLRSRLIQTKKKE